MQKSLENIIKDISLDDLSTGWQWQQDEIRRFSAEKSLFRFQQQAIENALKTLWLWKHGNESAKYLAERYKENQIQDIKEKDANRMGFWMATGSGKTLVIVKVIEMLSMLMKRGAIKEKKDILFLVYRDNLINQFKKHVDEYNIHNPYKTINLINLKEYEDTKRVNALPLSTDEINLFYYRADLFLEKKSTDKKIDPRNYYNNGNWFVLLDEAHRGDQDESKLKNIYNNFSRNGFIFNFSATFTDSIDLKTCAFNFNLEKFTQEKFGKQIYVSEKNSDMREKDDFSDIEKQRVVLKTLILQTYISQHYEKIKKIGDGLYHKPLLLTITNTVNEISKKSSEAIKQKSDLKMFFSEIEKIASGKIRKGLFDEAMGELEQELKDDAYLFGMEKINIEQKILSKIKYKNILESVFNAKKSGNIEVIYVKGNKQEIAFKMTNSDKPFALIRIGEIDKWKKNVLSEGYEKTVHYDGESFFESLNQPDSNINILMGSRTFYEGWDSNRPNIILFVNIGLGKDAKKFVLQSVGRGVRIEPEKGKRGRLQKLSNADRIDKDTYKAVQGFAHALESLFVFGTNAKNVKKIMEELKSEKGKEAFELEFGTNPYAKDKLLLVPVYEESNKTYIDEKVKYPISETDLDSVKTLFGKLSDKILLMKYANSSPGKMQKIREKINGMKKYSESRSIGNPELVTGNLLHFFNQRGEEFNKFDELEKEHIVHFTKIKFSGEENFDKLRKQISIMKEYPKHKEDLKRFLEGKKQVDIDEILKKSSLLKEAEKFEVKGKKFDIKYLARHYYHPLLVSHEEKAFYLTHVIDVESERNFIKELEKKANGWDDKFKWWMFSKLDASLDKVYIPYYNRIQNKTAKFHPDFIFWFENAKGYHILFVDPKGGAHISYQYKADGYEEIFGEVGKEKIITEHDKNIKVYLRFFGNNEASKAYKKYWISEVSDIPKILM